MNFNNQKNHDAPLISIIIPTYNSERYLSETIESVINQTYSNWELFLVDDCSRDNTQSLINSYLGDKRISLHILKENSGGPAVPRNKGIELANGEYIAFLDSDDIWEENKLEIQIKYISEKTIIHSSANIINEKGDFTGRIFNGFLINLLKSFLSKKTILIYKNFVNINTVLISKDHLSKFRTENFFHGIEDWLLWFEIASKEYKFIYLNQSLIKYRIHDNSISNRHNDYSFRKYIVGLTVLFLEKKINFIQLYTSFHFGLIRIVLRKLQII